MMFSSNTSFFVYGKKRKGSKVEMDGNDGGDDDDDDGDDDDDDEDDDYENNEDNGCGVVGGMINE